MMTYTEAAFIHETKVAATISTASIFPKTVDQLIEQAKQHKEVILHEYKEMKSKLNVGYSGDRTGPCYMEARTREDSF